MKGSPTVLLALILLPLLIGCGGPVAREETTDAATAETTPDAWYESEIRAFEEEDDVSPAQTGQVLFIGSSSIRMWKSLAADMAPVPVLNRGFGGSKTGDVLAVFDRIVLPYQPSVIVYYCGDNDLGTGNTDWQSAANGFITFARRAHKELPRVTLVYIPIKASLARWENWPAMRSANDAVRSYCERTARMKYVDTVTPTLTPEGRPDPAMFLDDGLHLSEEGYDAWTKVVRPAVWKAWIEQDVSVEGKR